MLYFECYFTVMIGSRSDMEQIFCKDLCSLVPDSSDWNDLNVKAHISIKNQRRTITSLLAEICYYVSYLVGAHDS